jgi:hypothetical protein
MLALTERRSLIALLCSLMLFSLPAIPLAYDINDKLSLDAMLSGVYQYGDFNISGLSDKDRGAVVLDLGANFHPSEFDEFQLTMSFAAGNGLNFVNPFSLEPYADDLEDDLKDIRNRNRDYLLEAWYKRTFRFSDNMELGITGGIIDSTEYIDDNAFANDENMQFMNGVFVNNPLANFPSYDIGGLVEFAIENFSIRGMMMNTRNEEDNNFNYYALQFGYEVDTPMGPGNYRIFGYRTSSDFVNWDETGNEKLQGVGLSFDQELSPIVGVFARFGWQDDDAAVDHDALYSGGVNINGKLWGRDDDNAGLGYAYLNGPSDGEIDNTNAVEAYVKFQLCQFSDITLDAQYLRDKLRDNETRNGFIYGVRMNAYF